MGMGISQKMGIGMGGNGNWIDGNGNVESHSRTSQLQIDNNQTLIPWQKGLTVPDMGLYSHYHAGRLLHFGLCISWRRSWDGGVKKTSQVRRVFRIAHSPVDCFWNSRPNQWIGCKVFEQYGPQNHLSLCRWQGGTTSVPTNLYCSAEIQRRLAARVVWEWCRLWPLADQLLTCLAFNPRDLYYRVY